MFQCVPPNPALNLLVMYAAQMTNVHLAGVPPAIAETGMVKSILDVHVNKPRIARYVPSMVWIVLRANLPKVSESCYFSPRKPPLKCKWGVCRHRDDPAELFSQSGLCAPCSTNADCPSETCLAGNCADASHGKVTSGCSCEKTGDCLPPLKCNGNVCNTELPGTRSLNDEVHQLIEANEAGWYKLVGLGQQLVASTCHHSTTFSAQISVFTSPSANCSVSDLCATNAEYYSCRDDRMAVSWYAEVDQVYYILVYAGDADQQQPQPSGERYFALSLHQASH